MSESLVRLRTERRPLEGVREFRVQSERQKSGRGATGETEAQTVHFLVRIRNRRRWA